MARSKNNVVTHGLSGTVGNLLVFAQRAGKTVVRNFPRASDIGPTPNQEAIRAKFKKAVKYAKTALADPALKKMYADKAGPGQFATNMAVADYFTPPVIQDPDLSTYTGAAGITIKVPVTDDFQVKSVKFIISHPDGSL